MVRDIEFYGVRSPADVSAAKGGEQSLSGPGNGKRNEHGRLRPGQCRSLPFRRVLFSLRSLLFRIFFRQHIHMRQYTYGQVINMV